MKYTTAILFTLLVITSARVTALESTPFQIPRSNVVEIKDPASQRVYPLFIKLPRTYSKNDNKVYPVIYLTDAFYSFQIVSGATRYPMNIGKMKEAIIVGISYSKSSKGDTSRIRDYTPSVAQSWKKETGGAQQHMEFIESSIIKYMDENYRTDKDDRTFVGNSLGGLFGSYILLTKPTLFNNYILGSPSYWFDNNVIFELEKKSKSKLITLNANVFIGIGELESKQFGSSYDMVKDAKTFSERIRSWKQTNLKLKIIVIPEANHQTAFPTTVIQGLHSIYKK